MSFAGLFPADLISYATKQTNGLAKPWWTSRKTNCVVLVSEENNVITRRQAESIVANSRRFLSPAGEILKGFFIKTLRNAFKIDVSA